MNNTERKSEKKIKNHDFIISTSYKKNNVSEYIAFFFLILFFH